jgi:hypothetical protein
VSQSAAPPSLHDAQPENRGVVPEGYFGMTITPDGTTIYVLDLGSSQHKEAW